VKIELPENPKVTLHYGKIITLIINGKLLKTLVLPKKHVFGVKELFVQSKTIVNLAFQCLIKEYLSK
jgi:hypothetical protein